ncbi:Craniofacial development protein 2 [Nymphon striatum]|nr:Craniofacial development protein 2 [Nymphon striatum]
MDVTSVTPSEVHSVNNLREGDQLLGSRNNCNDGNNLNSIERLSLDVVNMKTRKLGLRTATWNVRSMWQAGKLDNVIQEMETMRLDILGLCETRWTGCGTIQKKNHTMMYAGGDVHARGVCIIIKKKLLRSVKGFWTVSDRVILMKIAAKPFDLCIIQVYAPTSECEMEEIESFYEQVENTMKQVKPSDILIIMGDLNAKVGRGRHGNVVGNWGLGKRNERGERLIEFAEKNSMCIMNTWFSQPARKLYTWSSPGDIYRNQIDYILIKTRFKTSIHKVRTYPGADCNSDHNPVVASIKIRLKKEKPKSDVKREVFDLSSLKVETVKRDFQIRLENKFSILESHDDNLGVEESIDKAYEEIVKNVAETVKETLPKKEKPAKQPWMNDKILAMMKERRRLKGNRKKYRSKDKEIRKACKEAEEEWLNARCKEIENLEETKQWRPMHQKIKELGGSKRSNSAGIQDKNGNIIFEEDKVAGRWVEYIQELFKDADRGDKTVIENQEGATILETEVRFAISSMLDNKAPGGDGLTTEVLKAMNDKGISRITKLLNDIYENGHVPEGLTESIFVQLPKKPATVKCEEYRTISLMSHLTKVLLKVIMNRSRKVIEEEISEEQYGFRKDKGTRDAIFNLRVLCDRAIEVQKKIYILFLDYEKAFDRVTLVYLGQLFTKDGKCEDEIKRRIQIARNTFSKMNAIFKDQHLRLSTKLRVVRCYVIARLLYGAETWTLNETMEKRIRSLEMWFYRRILKIVWTDKISNKEVIKRIVDRGGWQLEIMKNIKRRKMQYCGHIIRAEGLQSNIMLGRLEGKRSRGRPRKRWLDDVKKWGRFTKVSSLVTTAKNRVKWKSVVHATLQMEDAT